MVFTINLLHYNTIPSSLCDSVYGMCIGLVLFVLSASSFMLSARCVFAVQVFTKAFVNFVYTTRFPLRDI